MLLRLGGYAAAKCVMGFPVPGQPPRKITCFLPVLEQMPRRCGLHCRTSFAKSCSSTLPERMVVLFRHALPNWHWSRCVARTFGCSKRRMTSGSFHIREIRGCSNNQCIPRRLHIAMMLRARLIQPLPISTDLRAFSEIWHPCPHTLPSGLRTEVLIAENEPQGGPRKQPQTLSCEISCLTRFQT